MIVACASEKVVRITDQHGAWSNRVIESDEIQRQGWAHLSDVAQLAQGRIFQSRDMGWSCRTEEEGFVSLLLGAFPPYSSRQVWRAFFMESATSSSCSARARSTYHLLKMSKYLYLRACCLIHHHVLSYIGPGGQVEAKTNTNVCFPAVPIRTPCIHNARRPAFRLQSRCS